MKWVLVSVPYRIQVKQYQSPTEQENTQGFCSGEMASKRGITTCRRMKGGGEEVVKGRDYVSL